MKSFHFMFKMIMIGDSGVGKTCILKRLEKSIYDENTANTIGIEFVRKQIMLNDNTILLQVWDTVGQENMHRYSAVLSSARMNPARLTKAWRPNTTVQRVQCSWSSTFPAESPLKKSRFG